MHLPDSSPRIVRAVLSRFPITRHASVLFLAFLLGLIFTNHFLLDDDPNKCRTLARTGKYHDGNVWIPDGCGTVGYRGQEIQDCTKGQKRKIVFAGNSYMQTVFWNVAARLDKTIEVPLTTGPGDLSFARGNVELAFYQDEWLNGTMLVHTVEDLKHGRGNKPMMMVVGGGTSFLNSGNVDGYRDAVANLAEIATSGKFPRSPPGANAVFTRNDGPGDLLLFVPALVGRAEKLHEGESLQLFREADRKLAEWQRWNSHVEVLWSWTQMMVGLEDGRELAKRRADVVLNMRCNAKVWHWPANKGVCCGVWRSPNWIQYSFLLAGLLVLPGIAAFDYARSCFSTNSRTIIRAFAAFSAAISLQYLADRTHVFEQVERFGWNFSIVLSMLTVASIFGFATMRRCKSSEKTQDSPFMPREQTDEWKGWMQLLIIIYHYNKAWEATWFWEIIRMAVSSYLFLTGFGHTLYHLQKKDYSLKRFVNIMIRTNLLPCTLAYIMNTRWLLYYYMPLSSFWYAVTFATLALGQKYNDKTWVLLSKIFISAVSVELFISTKDLAYTVVKIFNITCRISFDAEDFFGHRVGQDRYIVYVGMLSAILYLYLKEILSPTTTRTDALSRTIRNAFPALKHFTIGFSLITFATFWWYLQNYVPSQAAFTALQPYISFLPILTYTILRNAHPVFRRYHSVAFAWLGRYSGEMYVMQDHLWLAGDQEAILRSGLFHGNETLWGDRWRDLLVVTPLYLIACSVIGDATGQIAGWFLEERDGGNAAEEEVVEGGLLADIDGEMDEKMGGVQRRLGRMSLRLPWPGLKWRVACVLVGMWALNWTYT